MKFRTTCQDYQAGEGTVNCISPSTEQNGAIKF